MSDGKLQPLIADYHRDIAGSEHHGGHNMYEFHFEWHEVNRDPSRPSRPDLRWGADLVFGSSFLQMHHEMMKARDDEPKQHMMHASIAAWFASRGLALPAEWNPAMAIPADLNYQPDASVSPDRIQSLLADRARQLGVTVESLLMRATNDPRFLLPGWATRGGLAAGEAGKPVTGARKLADFVNANQLGCCLVLPHNAWHGRIGGAMGSTATAIADPIFYFGVHWHIDKVYDEFKLILNERQIRGHDIRSLTSDAVPTPAEEGTVAASFTPAQLKQFADESLQSAALHDLPSTSRTAQSNVSGAALASSHPQRPLTSSKVKAPRGVQELMAVPAPGHDKAWLQEALQNAIQLELSTIPPYLCAAWSVVNADDPVATTLKRIAVEEMMHMGLAANLLSAIGGAPQINSAAVVPTYPGEMPGGVHPGLSITLQGLTPESVKTFMEIEKPEFAPVVSSLHLGETYAPIGAFYIAIETAFAALPPADILAAIKRIREEGEGTQTVPTAGTKLAHYYQFGEIHHGKKAVQTATGWTYSGTSVPFPEVYPVAVVPAGGYAASLAFDTRYTQMLGKLQLAWTNGDAGPLDDAIDMMRDTAESGRQLMRQPLPQSGGNYCPSFRLVP